MSFTFLSEVLSGINKGDKCYSPKVVFGELLIFIFNIISEDNQSWRKK